MKIPCPKCSAQADKANESINCIYCGYSSDDFVVRRRNLATHRTNDSPATITRPLPHRKQNGSK